MIGESLHDSAFGNDFLDTMSIAQATKLSRDKLDYINIKTFYLSNDIIGRVKRTLKKWKKIFVNHVSGKELISKVYKEPL